MEVKKAVLERRSYRKFLDKKVSEEDIRQIVEAGLWAPSATNIQPWYYVAVSRDEAVEEIRDIASDGVEAFRPVLEERFSEHPEVVRNTTSFIATLGGAPFILLAFARLKGGENDMKTVQGIAAGIENMILAALEKDIRSCWLTSLCSGKAAERLHERFAPERGGLVALVAFGYSTQEPRAPKRKEDRAKFLL